MIIVNVRMTVHPNKRDEYLAFITDLVNRSMSDHGNIVYAHYQDVDSKNRFIIVEHWATQEDLDQHLQTPHLKRFEKEIGEYAVKEPELLIMKKD